MCEDNPGHNTSCDSDEHTQHLCYFVSYGYNVDNESEYDNLVRDPKFKCTMCGRLAQKAESLCMPKPLNV